MIERNFAERLKVTKDGEDAIKRIHDEAGVKWLFSFLSADKMKTYCLYEAPNARQFASQRGVRIYRPT
jgi:hypothetical protein